MYVGARGKDTRSTHVLTRRQIYPDCKESCLSEHARFREFYSPVGCREDGWVGWLVSCLRERERERVKNRKRKKDGRHGGLIQNHPTYHTE